MCSPTTAGNQECALLHVLTNYRLCHRPAEPYEPHTPKSHTQLLKLPLCTVIIVKMVDTDIAILTTSHEAVTITEPGQGVHRSKMPLYSANLLLIYHVPEQCLKLPRGTPRGGHVLGILASTQEYVVFGVFGHGVEWRDRGVVQRTVRLVSPH